MTLRGKGKIGCDLNQAVITELQQILCLFNLFFTDIITDRDADFLFKKPGQVAGGKTSMRCQVFHRNPLFNIERKCNQYIR